MDITLKTLIRALAESSRIGEHDPIFCTPSGAHFRSLSRRQQNALLDRGYGPR